MNYSIPFRNGSQLIRILSLVVLVILILICCVFYRMQVPKIARYLNPQSLLDNLSLPALLAAISLYANYGPKASFAAVGGGNLFEFGLTSTVVQQFFDFGKIPFVTIVNPHGFMDIYYAIFYSLINGYQPFDSFLWQWITPVIIVVAGYFFLKEFVEGPVAFLLMLFLPVFGIFNFNTFFILIAGIFFVQFWKDPQLRSYIILLIVLLFTFLWRAESGVSSVLAICLISVVLYFKILKKSPSQIWKDYSKYIYATIGIFAICTLIYIALCLINHESPVTAVQSVASLYIINHPVGTVVKHVYDLRCQCRPSIRNFSPLRIRCCSFFYLDNFYQERPCNCPTYINCLSCNRNTFPVPKRSSETFPYGGISYLYFPLIACSIPILWYQSKKLLSIVLVILILGTRIFYCTISPDTN